MKHKRPHSHPRRYKSGKVRFINPHIKKRVKRNYGGIETKFDPILEKMNEYQSEYYVKLGDGNAKILYDMYKGKTKYLKAGQIVPLKEAYKTEMILKS